MPPPPAHFPRPSRALVVVAESLPAYGSSTVGIYARSVGFKERKNYQRLRPPPPPPLRSPPNPDRLSWGRASLTVMLRPSNSVPFRAWIAFWASALELISTKPKPLDRPENLSMIIRADSTVPCAVKRSSSCLSVVAYDSPPT